MLIQTEINLWTFKGFLSSKVSRESQRGQRNQRKIKESDHSKSFLGQKDGRSGWRAGGEPGHCRGGYALQRRICTAEEDKGGAGCQGGWSNRGEVGGQAEPGRREWSSFGEHSRGESGLGAGGAEQGPQEQLSTPARRSAPCVYREGPL